MSLGLVIAAPDAAEKFGGGGRLEDHRILTKAELEGHSLYKRSQVAAAGGQREASISKVLIGTGQMNQDQISARIVEEVMIVKEVIIVVEVKIVKELEAAKRSENSKKNENSKKK